MTDRAERRRSTMPLSPSNSGPDSSREGRVLRLSELHEICACGDVDRLDEVLKAGRSEFVNYKDPDWEERTPLHWCSLKGKGDMVRRLLDRGAHPGLRSSCGWTAAHFAAEAGKTNVLRALHSMNSPMDRRDLFGDTPKRIAQIYGHKDAVDFLSTAEEEYRERRTRTELSGEAEPYDDEDMEWCVRNSFKPDAFISADDLSTDATGSLSLKSFAESVASSKRSGRNKARHYGKSKQGGGGKSSSRSPKTGRRKSNDSSGKSEGKDSVKKAGKSGKRTPTKSPQRKKASLDRISEAKSINAQ